MYKAIDNFVDLQDNNYRYHTGDVFPRKGIDVSKERIEELASDKNRRHKPVIVEVKEPKPEVVKEEGPVENKPTKGRKKKTDVK